jgi:hypothetical protein
MADLQADDLKAEVQRRRYRECRRLRRPIPPDLAALFEPCPRCGGRNGYE